MNLFRRENGEFGGLYEFIERIDCLELDFYGEFLFIVFILLVLLR